MPQDYFAVFGLTSAGWTERELTTRYRTVRARLLSELDNPARHADARARLDELYLAYRTLRDPQRRAAYERAREGKVDPVTIMRGRIEAALEGGLLRYSRRVQIIDQARELGLNEFQTQLLIAQVQFGEQEIRLLPRVTVRALPQATPQRIWSRLAGVGVLAGALFLFLLHWLGG
jgi:hypothetical protein